MTTKTTRLERLFIVSIPIILATAGIYFNAFFKTSWDNYTNIYFITDVIFGLFLGLGLGFLFFMILIFLVCSIAWVIYG